MRFTFLGSLAVLVAAAGGCSNSASQLLTTGALTGGQEKKAAGTAAAEAPVKPEDRAIAVAATSARAQKCGYYFDAAKLRTSYLDSEAQGGVQPDELARLTKIYDYTASKVTSAIATKDDYCDADKVGEIKTSLTRHLAGDFAPPKRKKDVASGSWFDVGEPEANTKEVLNPDWVNNPTVEPQTKRVEED